MFNLLTTVLIALSLTPSTTHAANSHFTPSSGYKTLSLTSNGNITRVEIYNPPINLMNGPLITDLLKFLHTLEQPSPEHKIVIFSSADPIFFISHLDLHGVSQTSPPLPPYNASYLISAYTNITTLLTTVPSVLIAEISGQAAAAGNEFAVRMDMRFACTGALFSAPEASLGVPHAFGIQHLVRLVGPGRAAEHLLAATDADAARAAEWGWVNRAFSSQAAMRRYVDELARRIALFPAGGLEATKRGIRDGFGPRPGTVEADVARFGELAATPVSQALVEKYLLLSMNQSRGRFELHREKALLELYK